MKRGRAKPTWASSVMRTRYSELLNFGALSFLSISRMVKVVITVASDGLRSSFNSVALQTATEERGIERKRERHEMHLIALKMSFWMVAVSTQSQPGIYSCSFIGSKGGRTQGNHRNRLKVRPREGQHMYMHTSTHTHVDTMRFR